MLQSLCMALQISLSRGMVALIDDEDFELVSQFKWYARKGHGDIWYAVRDLPRKTGKGIIWMHRTILGLPRGRYPEVDHRDHNGLNNQRSNIRACFDKENQHNVRPHIGKKFKGIHEIRAGKWRVRITVNDRRMHVGVFDNKIDAVNAYNRAASLAFGDSAWINPVEPSDPIPLTHPNTWGFCRRGHDFNEINTYTHPITGKRNCRICKRAADRRRYHEEFTRS